MTKTLPQRMYLLMYNVDTEKFETHNLQFRGQKVRAAALAQLVGGGLVGLREGKRRSRAARKVSGAPDDSFLAEVWRQIPSEDPKDWLDLLHPYAHTAESSVREQLTDAGVIAIPPVKGLKRLSLLSQHEVRVNRPADVLAIRQEVRGPVLGGVKPESLPFEDLAMTAIAEESDLYHVFSREERREYKSALKEYGECFDGQVPGLRHALRTSIQVLRPSGGGWGQ
ncbi:GOLPH3/VPS74 family protein [Streptomyces axinellae]|uniref:GPP34 family phosphoprotein n=1 Tax=Streptomyces axinellae TaxID=552788 RepID=A0ABN3Q546_9ACTN